MILMFGSLVVAPKRSQKEIKLKKCKKLVETIRDGLIAQHPDKKILLLQSLSTNAEKYLKKLKTLDKEYTEALSQALIPKQKSFHYF